MSNFTVNSKFSKTHFERWMNEYGGPQLGWTFIEYANISDDINKKIDAWVADKEGQQVPVQFRCCRRSVWHKEYNIQNCIYVRAYTSSLNASEITRMEAKYFVYIAVDDNKINDFQDGELIEDDIDTDVVYNIWKWCVLDVNIFKSYNNKEYILPTIEDILKSNNGYTQDVPAPKWPTSFEEPELYKFATVGRKADPVRKVPFNTFIRIPIKDEFRETRNWSIEKNIPEALVMQEGFI